MRIGFLLKYLLTRPSRWFAAVQLASAILTRSSDARLTVDGLTLVCGPRGGQGVWCGLSGCEYESELPLFLGLLSAGDIVLDIGANIGAYAFRASRVVGAAGRVIAFEPLPANRDRLAEGKKINGLENLTICGVAAGDQDGKVTLYAGARMSSASMVRVAESNSIEVPVRRVDDLLPELNLPRVDWVKMDIEGAEPMALRGMKAILRDFQPGVLFENDAGGAEAASILEAAGYEIGTVLPNGTWKCTRAGGNLFAITPGKLKKLFPGEACPD